MAFIQITDLHFVPAETDLFGLSPADRFGPAIEKINADHADAEFVLITGDLVHRGDVAAYEALRDALAPLIPPVHLMLGNHDSRAAFAEVFGGERDENGFVQFVIRAEGGRVICLDTLIDESGRSDGQLCAARLDWLAARIAEVPEEEPWLLALHHPPMELGLAHMDGIRLADGDALWEVLFSRPPVMMLHGHVHRPIHGIWRGTPFHIQRGVNHQVAYTSPDVPGLMFADEPPEFTIVTLRPEGPVLHSRSYMAEGAPFPKS
ncbi:phosphodiesterase [Rhodobacteraceae bacterium NNCM2]|nr:phosphodiesterase [Coraliihabitans acroporae]